MDNTGIASAVIEQIRQLAMIHAISAVYLFGSRARGGWHRASDIDLAIRDGDADAFRYELENNTDTLLTFDVVNLNNVEERFAKIIEKEGSLIYEKI